jgi:thiamine biosynthesis lipoprotein
MALHTFRFKAMGCPCALQLHADSALTARSFAASARGEIERLEQKYSRYRADSLLSRINASAGESNGVEVDAETASLLDYAATCHAQSGGRFDVTSGILRRAWNFRSGRLPEPARIAELLPLVGWEKVRWSAGRIALPRAGMELDLGGYVKEYAADRVAALLCDAGCRSALVDLGGDLAIAGPHPDGKPWIIGVRDASRPDRAALSVPVYGGGVATSGDYERCMVVDGVRYGHILDPRTGWPIAGLASVTVFAPRCLVAGSATTIALLQGDRAPAWLDALGLPHVRQAHGGAIECRLATAPAPRAPRAQAARRARARARQRGLASPRAAGSPRAPRSRGGSSGAPRS